MGLSDKFAKLHKSPNKVVGRNDKSGKKTKTLDSGKQGDKKKGKEGKSGGQNKKNGKKGEKKKDLSEAELNNDMDAYWHKAGKGPDPQIKALDNELEAMAAKKAEADAKK